MVAGGSEILACLCFALFLLAILAQVAYRYLGFNLVFSEELARMMNVYVVFIGLIVVTRSDGHIRIDLLERMLGEDSRAARVLGILHLLLMFGFLVMVAIGSWQLTVGGWNSRLATISWISHGHVYLAPLVGSTMAAVVVLMRLVDGLAPSRDASPKILGGLE
jgi:TRAP-type C4-dicarboxylate transport system permease small subunit